MENKTCYVIKVNLGVSDINTGEEGVKGHQNKQNSILPFSDIDDCENVTCLNNATCQDYVDSFQCLCQFGFTGVYCDTCTYNYLYYISSRVKSWKFPV